MNKIELSEIKDLPEKYKPLSAWAYFGYTLLFTVVQPIGLIFLIIFACSNSNINRRSFARSFFCGLIVILAIVLVAILILLLTGVLANKK